MLKNFKLRLLKLEASRILQVCLCLRACYIKGINKLKTYGNEYITFEGQAIKAEFLKKKIVFLLRPERCDI